MSTLLRGVLTALATPFTSDGQIDESALRRLVDRSIDGGVDGVVACGSTGEFAAMSGTERRFVVETVVDQAANRVPVVAQTGAVSTLPVATGVNLYPDTVGRLAREVDNIRYIKDTSADMAQAGQLIHRHGDVISTFVGWDSLLLAAITEGAAGVMAGTANVMPAQLVSVHRALIAGDLNRARREWAQLYPLMDAIMSAPFIPAIKTALNALGFPAGTPRNPLAELDAATTATISQLATELPQFSASA